MPGAQRDNPSSVCASRCSTATIAAANASLTASAFGDPASLWLLLPTENARRHEELIGRDKLLEAGRTAIEAADYR